MSKPVTLAERMRKLLATGEYQQGSVFRRIRLTDDQRAGLEHHAAELETITPETGAKALLGIWARARRFWCDLTGEPLV